MPIFMKEIPSIGPLILKDIPVVALQDHDQVNQLIKTLFFEHPWIHRVRYKTHHNLSVECQQCISAL